MSKALIENLVENTKEGVLYERLPDKKVRCFACGNRCLIPEGKAGVCRMRFNESGKLFVPNGYVSGIHADPIEKKPFFHVLPGARAMSFGMLGCNFHCSFCQNWMSSQTLRNPAAGTSIEKLSPKEFVKYALESQCQIVTSTYNEPLITSEWAVEIFKEAKKAGLITAYVSNGHATPEVLNYLRPWLDLYKVDLKCFDEKNYRSLGGDLNNICNSIKMIFELGFWIEVVTLLIPGFNDSSEELTKLTEFLVSVSPNIPWHVTAFHGDYEMTDFRDTTAEDLLRASEIGKASGIHYVYTGNLPGMTGKWENTYCHSCGELLVERVGFRILNNKIREETSNCAKCGTNIPGLWIKK